MLKSHFVFERVYVACEVNVTKWPKCNVWEKITYLDDITRCLPLLGLLMSFVLMLIGLRRWRLGNSDSTDTSLTALTAAAAAATLDVKRDWEFVERQLLRRRFIADNEFYYRRYR